MKTNKVGVDLKMKVKTELIKKDIKATMYIILLISIVVIFNLGIIELIDRYPYLNDLLIIGLLGAFLLGLASAFFNWRYIKHEAK